MAKKKTFSCQNCGESYDAYPPDDIHDSASIEEQYAKEHATGSVISIPYTCINLPCDNVNTLYWYHQKIAFAIG